MGPKPSLSQFELGLEGPVDPNHPVVSDNIPLIMPLNKVEFMGVLMSKPTKDWTYITTFLIERRLLVLPKIEQYFQRGPGCNGLQVFKNRELTELEENAKAARKKAHEERTKQQAAASAAKKARVAAGQKLREEQQKAAKARRVAARKAAHESRQSAIAKRLAAVKTDVKVSTLRRGADVRRWISQVRSETLEAHTDLDLRVAIDSLPPLECNRQIVRPVRTLVTGTLSQCTEATRDAFKMYQISLQEADRHLHYLFNEADSSGWRTVQRKKIRSRPERVASTV